MITHRVVILKWVCIGFTRIIHFQLQCNHLHTKRFTIKLTAFWRLSINPSISSLQLINFSLMMKSNSLSLSPVSVSYCTAFSKTDFKFSSRFKSWIRCYAIKHQYTLCIFTKWTNATIFVTSFFISSMKWYVR